MVVCRDGAAPPVAIGRYLPPLATSATALLVDVVHESVDGCCWCGGSNGERMGPAAQPDRSPARAAHGAPAPPGLTWHAPAGWTWDYVPVTEIAAPGTFERARFAAPVSDLMGPGPFLRVLSPADQDVWSLGVAVNVSWTSFGVAPSERLEVMLYRETVHPLNYVAALRHAVPNGVGWLRWLTALPAGYSSDAPFVLQLAVVANRSITARSAGVFYIS